jgi:uncharacterized protein (DUF2147 family)
MIRMAVFLAAGALCALPALAADEPSAVGYWVTRNEGAVVQILPCDSGLCGYLVGLSLNRPAGDQPKDVHNPDPARRGEPVCGLALMGSLKPVGSKDGALQKWEDGWVYDPQSGDTYSAEMKLEEPNVLKLRGYLGISLLGRSERWTREGDFKNRCKPSEAQ